ncbi:MAG: ABC transporter permease [Verrucomicrobiota bacterium]|nr:ABC transporter permease [Verrucomicrobiota bacterium]
MNTFLKDLQYAARMLLKNPGFSAIAVIALALGIGANTAIFSVVSAVLLRPLPFPQPEQIVAVWGVDKNKKPDSRVSFSFPDFADVRGQNQVFNAMAGYDDLDMTATDRGAEAEHLHGMLVTSDLFRVLGVNPILGRAFTAEDDKPGARVVVLSYELWQRRFGGDRNILEKTITLNETPHQIIGVMPQAFRFPIERTPAVFWTSAATQFEAPPGSTETTAAQRGFHYLRSVARLKPGVTTEVAEANAKTIMASLATQFPDTNKRFDSSRVIGLLSDLTSDVRPALVVLLAAAGCVLLIACVNVANLLLARATAREKEMGIRSALGASRIRIFRQLLTESALLSLAGGGAGMLLAVWGTAALASLLPQNFPRATEIAPDFRVLAFTALVSLFTGLVFGLAPAWRVSRPDVVSALNESARGSSETARGRRLRGILVTAEMVLAFVLLVGAGLLIRSFWQLQKVPLGFDPNNVMTANVSLPDGDGGPAVTKHNEQFYVQLMDRANAIPGVRSVAAVNPLPLSGSEWRTGFDIAGRPTAKSDRALSAVRVVTPGYFSTMKIPLRKGRDFDPRDKFESPGVVIVNESLVRQYFPNEDPIGKHITPQVSLDVREPIEREIVGVVGDVKAGKLTSANMPELYLPHTQASGGSMTIVARTQMEPQAVLPSLRGAVESLNKDLPLYETRTMQQYIDRAVAQPRLNMTLLIVFAGVAIVLTAVGIYGVMAYSVAQRTQEIGIRMALGAQRLDVLRLIVGQGARLVVLAMIIGVAAAFAMTRSIASLLYGVAATDFPTLFSVAFLLALIALLACWLPARRASGIDPITALRTE